ncbi:hypothetical protein AB0N38_33450 [Micromonospora aurantiaca]|uniref:Uncharacterized protein n=1 Tax=Micromonospora aurantiaca (nom. illeg.) TaxID=47850 RepID=A0ABQ6UAD7_9ACTN|nr:MULTISPECIES: hypothetical protein [Micromonospora]KAB1107690.1 hypothetical protein F6X54_25525 [Micromonospora aurantiaca]MBC8989943.1 hypothetical protein [Micromonospora chalcea]MCT2280710.1 hypothetical protein [Micromonospora chalcea]MDG4752692.1 hypothetical protein [Micromonospora sp. WMMD718]OHX07009.1 hypothetical protein BFV98_30640 [Micromonospora sp. WMMB235]
MRDGLHGPNVITAGEAVLLLVAVAGGEAVHLARRQGPLEQGRSAVPDHYLTGGDSEREAVQRRYDVEALREPIWEHTTMCGRVWALMVGGDGGTLSRYREPAFAPTCRRCLTLMDRLFPAPAVDRRVPVVAQVVCDVVREHGHAEVRQVPGDQLAVLRKEIRSLIRQQTGHHAQTLVHGDLLLVVCDPLRDAEAEMQAAAEAVGAVLFGDQPLPAARPGRPWVVTWTAWDLG